MKTLREVAPVAFLLLLRKFLRLTGWRQYSAFVMRRPTPDTARIGRMPELLMYLTRRLLL